jgi:hypothetical protein
MADGRKGIECLLETTPCIALPFPDAIEKFQLQYRQESASFLRNLPSGHGLSLTKNWLFEEMMMRLRLALVFLALSVSTSAQSYSGYMNLNGQGLTPLVSYKANAVLRCTAAYSSNHINYPEGCYLNGWLLRLNQTATAPAAGSGYLYCQGQAYLSCTLTVTNPGVVSLPPILPVPTPDPYSGSGWTTLNGPNDHPDACDHKAMQVDLPSTIAAGQVTTVKVAIVGNFGGGFCTTGGGGYVDWGDEKRDYFPTIPAPANDPCATEGTARLKPGPYTRTHTYTLVQDHSLFAHAQADFKDNGDPHTKLDLGNSGSWRCTAQKRQTISVTAPVATSGVHFCRTKKVKGVCPTPPAAK